MNLWENEVVRFDGTHNGAQLILRASINWLQDGVRREVGGQVSLQCLTSPMGVIHRLYYETEEGVRGDIALPEDATRWGIMKPTPHAVRNTIGRLYISKLTFSDNASLLEELQVSMPLTDRASGQAAKLFHQGLVYADQCHMERLRLD